MDKNVRDRLRTFIASQNMSVRRFEVLCGFPNSFVSNMKRTTSPARLEIISAKFPELNISWLMTGQGEMLNDTIAKSKALSHRSEENNLEELCKNLLVALEQEHLSITALIEQNERLIKILEERERK